VQLVDVLPVVLVQIPGTSSLALTAEGPRTTWRPEV
jgi:hypothetical protein